ncbi:MAG TPA: SPW repeat protein [Burkholderiaceae bacterium]
MTPIRNWQDPVIAVAGVALMASPWWLGFQNVEVAMLDALACGTLLLVTAVAASLGARPWQAWLEMATGLWVIASPWTLRFATRSEALVAAVVLGTVATLLAVSVLLLDGHVDEPRGQH